jgi:hypothetical protein
MGRKYKTLGTKISPEAYDLLATLAEKRGLTRYQIIQMMCDVAVRYMSDDHNLSTEINQLMVAFDHMVGWDAAYNLAVPTDDPACEQAVYIMHGTKYQGERAVMVTRPPFGPIQQTYNVQAILERVMAVLVPETYRRLRLLAVELGCSSMVELMLHLVDHAALEHFDNDMRREYRGETISDWEKRKEAPKYKTRAHKSPEP